MKFDIRNQLASRAKNAIAHPPSSPIKKGTKLRKMVIEPGEGGGFIAENHMQQGTEYVEPTKYPLRSGAELLKHVKQHLTGS